MCVMCVLHCLSLSLFSLPKQCVARVCVPYSSLSPLPELREEMGLCSRSVFGVEPSQMSFLFFLVYAAAAGGLLPLLESTPGSAQELKIKVEYRR